MSDLYDQNNKSLVSLLDTHAPKKSKLLKKPAPSWITEPYREAKRARRQFERVWRKNKSFINRSRLRRQVSKCNNFITSDKSHFYTEVIQWNYGTNYGKN